MEFHSQFGFRDPNVKAYEAQKELRVISPTAELLYRGAPSMPSMLLGNGALETLWKEYYSLRLVAAAHGTRKQYITRFPGHTVPGSGAGANTRYTGSLALERFEHLLSLAGGFPPIGPFADRCATPKHTIEDAPLVDWPWDRVEQPRLKILVPTRMEATATQEEKYELLSWLQRGIESLVGPEVVPVCELFALISSAWSPYTRSRVYAPETIRAARHILNEVKANTKKEWCDWLAFAFELETCLSCIEYSWPLNVTSYGVYKGCWVEVGRLPIAKIQSTELVVVKRVLAELVNIRTKGFAPIIVNELGCDTDGTHRLVASWLWNLIQELDARALVADHPELVYPVKRFIEVHARDMGPAVVREVLRSLAEILANAEMRDVLATEVLPYVTRYYPITHLPVLLLPEYSCGAVIKGPYDEGTASYRVDPTVYEYLARDPSCVLPARGPYHLTDRALLPWFEVLELR
ncbi:MAG: hypothetical protein DDT19_02846 [Syntrophomonadaceae bacterium]|nr:hypothetical protein [Bacillota bacterium]